MRLQIRWLVLGPVLAWSLVLGSGGCSKEVDQERSASACTDQQDNDGDGLVDCDDPDCRALPVCLPADGGVDAGADSGIDLGSPLDGLAEGALPDGPLPQQEQEPNDGAAEGELNAITVPLILQGSIGTADDLDLFSWDAQAGDRLTITVTSEQELQAHLAVFGETSLNVPPAVSAGPDNGAMAEYYVLKSGTYYIAVRDRRNVGTSSQHVGGTDFGYTLTVNPLVRDPIPVTVGRSASAVMTPPGVVRVFAFSANQDDQLTIDALAQRLSPPSDVDTRLSLFFPAQGAWLGTNEDLSQDQTDSLLEGGMPYSGTYHAIVENVAPPGSCTTFDIMLRVQQSQ